MGRARNRSTLVALAVLGTACAGVPETAARMAVHLTVFVYPAQVDGGCAVVTIPQYVYARQNDDIAWDVSNEACSQAGEVTIEIEPSVVDVTEKKGKEKKGKVTGRPGPPHKYKVRLDSGFVEDPRIEIW